MRPQAEARRVAGLQDLHRRVRPAVRLRAAAGQCHAHLPESRREPRQRAAAVARGPITGLIVQPLVGYYSDRTWTRFGRRRPYFLAGAALARCALVAMPNATTLWTAMLMLWMLDASLNFTMGPFRAFVADQMPAEQRATGYLMYMFFASIGAVVGSLLPWVMARLGFSSAAAAGAISEAVKMAFAVGAVLLVAAVCCVGVHDREYPPEDARGVRRRRRRGAPWNDRPRACAGTRSAGSRLGLRGLARGVAARGAARLYVLVFASMAYGVSLLAASPSAAATRSRASSTTWNRCPARCAGWRSCSSSRGSRCSRSSSTPRPRWRSCTSARPAPGSAAYEAGANWVGVLFATYNGLGALAALILPLLRAAVRHAAHAPGQPVDRRGGAAVDAR